MCDMVAGCTERYEVADGVNLIGFADNLTKFNK